LSHLANGRTGLPTLAIELSRRGRPVDLRAAVGRAYYAAFNVAAEVLRSWNIPVVRNAAGHGEVLRFLGNADDADLQQATRELVRLRNKRNAADYDPSARDVEDQKAVQFLVDRAGWVIDTLDQCAAPARSVKIIAAIQDFRRKIAPPGPGTP
jgi:uncharacterized protein (UPF0332 family)